MSTPRSIETRLLEAVWRETVACFDDAQRTVTQMPSQFGGGAWPALGLAAMYGGPSWAIKPFPLMMPPEGNIQIRTPRQINISNVPPDFESGAGGVNDSEKLIELIWFFPVKALLLTPGENGFLDEIKVWQAWMRSGGTHPNAHGALADPDFAGKWINDNIGRITWSDPQYLKGNAAAGVSVMIEFGVRENLIGGRA